MMPVDDWLDANRACALMIDRDPRPVSGSLSSVAARRPTVKWRCELAYAAADSQQVTGGAALGDSRAVARRRMIRLGT